jgi:hypothetical protein
MWRGGLGLAYLLPALSFAGASLEDLHLQAVGHARHTTKPLARQTLRVRYFRHYGLLQHPESPFAFRL